MNDVVIIGPAYPLRGGLASYDERLARALTASGRQAVIYTFSYQYPAFLFPGTTQYSSEPAPKDITIKVNINSVNPINWFIVGNELRRLRPDLIVVRYWLPFMGPCLGTILRRVKKNKHTKIVCIADNIFPHEKRPGDKPFTTYFLKSVDGFITMSDKVLQDLRHFAPGKPAQFVPHPLYDNFGEKVSKKEAREKLNIPPQNQVILFFGFIRKYKGLDILLQAMKILRQKTQTQNIKLLIAGEFYEDERNYLALLNDPAIQENLLPHTHFIADSMVKYYLCAADCVIQPYRSATQSGVTPLAYHFEIPMIVTNVGGLPSLVPDRKVGLVSEPDAANLAATIAKYFELGEEFFLTHLRKEKLKYSWDNMVQEIMKIAYSTGMPQN